MNTFLKISVLLITSILMLSMMDVVKNSTKAKNGIKQHLLRK